MALLTTGSITPKADKAAQPDHTCLSELGRNISQLTVENLSTELLEDIASSEKNTKEIAQIIPTNADELDSINVKNTDGSYSVFTFQQNVKYVDEATNEIKFIDNTLEVPSPSLLRVFSDVAYENKANDIKVALPKTTGQGVRVENGSAKIRMTPVTEENPGAVKKEASFLGDTRTLVEYTDAFGQGAHLQYAAVSNGVKENILLDKYTGMNEFQFMIDAPGLTPDAAGGSVVNMLDESTGEPVFRFNRAWAMDSYAGEKTVTAEQLDDMDIADEAGAYSEAAAPSMSESKLSSEVTSQSGTEPDEADTALENEISAIQAEKHFEDDITYRIEARDSGRYLLTLVINEQFLSSPDTVYPVLIDPYTTSFKVGYSEGGMPYTTVFSETSETWPSTVAEYIQTGYRSGYGEAIGYIQFTSLNRYKHINPNNIIHATVNLKQTYGSSSTYTVGTYDSNTSMSTTSATYSTLSNNIGTQQDYNTCGINQTYNWWIDDIFKAWLQYDLNGTGWNSYQFMLKATSTGKAYKQFYCSNSNLWFQVDYTVDDQLNGLYYTRNYSSNKYLDITWMPPQNGCDICQYTYIGNLNQLFEVCTQDNGRYKIYSKYGNEYSLALKAANGIVTANNNTTGAEGSFLEFYIVSNNDGTYRIMSSIGGSTSVQNPVALGVTTNSNEYIRLSSYTGNSKQKWVLEK